MKKKDWTEEETENFIGLIKFLQKLEKEQKNMTEEEKRSNAIKIHDDKGDIFY